MPKSFRAFIEHSDRSTSGYAASWKRAVSILTIVLAVIVWFASAGTLIASALVAFGAAVLGSGHTWLWGDMMAVSLVAIVFVGASVLARDFTPVLIGMWTKLEDMLGRALVIVHSGTCSFSTRNGQYLRKVIAFIAISAVLFGELVLLKWVFNHLSAMTLVDGDSLTSLVGNPHTFMFALWLTIACIVMTLLLRYTVSAKWQAIYSKPQFLENELPSPPASVPNVRILHATDFHITGNDLEPLTEGGATFHLSALTTIMGAIAHDAGNCDAVLVTGDITDTGSAAAWCRFLDHCPAHVAKKMILVPGNHDLNLQDRTLASKAEQHDWADRRARQINMMAAMAEIMQERAFVLDRASDRLFTLARYVERHQATLDIGSVKARKPTLGVDELWKALFPMVVPIGPMRDGRQLGVLVLDSIKPGSIGLTNAIGTVSPDVIDACSAIMKKMNDRCDAFVVALHHHVAMPAGGSLPDRIQNAGLVLENASLLIDMLAKRGDPTVVFHGHRHMTYTGVAAGSDVAIVASPSATIGRGGLPGTGSWRLLDLFCSEDGCWLLDHTEGSLKHRRTVSSCESGTGPTENASIVR